MKARVEKIRGIAVNENYISANVVCSGVKVGEIIPSLKGIFLLNKERLSCTVSTVSIKKDGECSLTLKFSDSRRVLNSIYPFHHKSNLDFALLIQENVEPDLYEEASQLLQLIAKQIGQRRGDILYELTSFKDIKGKRDLRFVSSRQMPVLIDKMRGMLKIANHKGECA